MCFQQLPYPKPEQKENHKIQRFGESIGEREFKENERRELLPQPTREEKFGKLVRPTGIEPVTLGFEVQYSIQLSYGRTPFLLLRLLGKAIGKVAHVIPVHQETRQL